MEMGLAGKVALVTGASRGIGAAIARRLGGERMRVALAARTEADLRGVAAQIDSSGGQSLVYPADLSTPSAPATFAAATLERFGQIDLVVNNAGATKRGDFLALSEQDWAEFFLTRSQC